MSVVTPQLPAAVLWDMDGTLVDTEPYWISAEVELVGSFGGEWTDEDSFQLIGNGLWESAAVFQRYGVDLPADEIVDRLTASVTEQLATNEVPWRPGARELLRAVHDAGIPSALVTMSIRSMADAVVRAIPFEAFDAIVTGDVVAHPKPHPEAYLRGAELLGVPIARCVAIEDSPPGVTSAAASGAVAIGVPNIVELDEAPADIVWPTLAGRTVADLAELVRALRADSA